MTLPTQLVDTSCVTPLTGGQRAERHSAISHPEEDDRDRCVADEHSSISCADLDALTSVPIGSNHHSIPKFLSKSASWPPSPVPTAATELLPGLT